MGESRQAGLPGMGPFKQPRRRGRVRYDFSDLTTAEVAAACGVTVQAVSNWQRTGCPYSKDDDGRLHFDLPAVIAWRRERDVENSGGSPSDVLLEGAGVSSDALERLRHLRADKVQLELEQERGELVERDVVIEQFREASRVLRTHLEGVQRRFGDEVGDAIRDAIDQAVAELDLE